jgi:WD40 repeat protein
MGEQVASRLESLGTIAQVRGTSLEDPSVIFWGLDSLQRVGEPLTGPDRSHVMSMAYSSDGRILALGGGDAKGGLITFLDARTHQPIGKPLRGHGFLGVAGLEFSPDGNLMVSLGLDGTVILWDTKSQDSVGELFKGHDDEVHSVTFSPDGRMLATAGNDGKGATVAL